MLFDYDDRDVESILNYARNLEGKTFQNIVDDFEVSHQKRYINKYDATSVLEIEETSPTYVNNKNAKGQVGNIIEQCYFGYKPNSNQEADFPKVEMELKQTCIDTKKNGDFTAGERLSITNISYNEPVVDDFYKSHVWAKIKLILLVHYLRDKEMERLDNVIKFINVFTPPEEDLKIIMNDYHEINKKIKAGKAHEISEGDTIYLGACTKGATAVKSIQPQYYGEHLPAKKRNYCFKRSYMDYVLNEYILKLKVPYKIPKTDFYQYNVGHQQIENSKVKTIESYESIIDDKNILSSINFEEYIHSKMKQYIGMSDVELSEYFLMEYEPKNKSFWSTLTFRMLGVKGRNKSAEFMKAGIVARSIRVEESGRIKESMPLPSFKFKDLVDESWEESELFNYLSETKFFFSVFKKEGNSYCYQGSMFWNIPIDELENVVFKGWNNIRRKIIDGVSFKIKNNIVSNDLPKKKDNNIIHIRPHTSQSAYLLRNGYRKGRVEEDGDFLPQGEWMTRQSFWLNNSYLLKVIKRLNY